MARIPRSSRTVLSSGRVAGGQIPSDIADTGQGLEARALGAIGKGISDVGNVLLEIEIRKDRATDLTQSGLDDQAQKTAEEQIAIIEQDVSINDRTADFYEQEYASRFTFDESKYGTKRGAKLGKIDFESRRDSFISGRRIRNGQLAIKGAIQLTEQNYITTPTPENRVKYAEALSFQDDEDGVTAKLKVADARAKETIQGQTRDVIVSNALRFTVKDGPAQGLPDTEAGLKAIRESGLSPREQVKANTTYNALVKQQKDAIEVQREADRDALNTALTNDELTPIKINATSLSETEQLTYDKLYRSWAKDGPQITTNEQVRADLRANVVNIWRNANTKQQVMALLNEARYGDNPTIDDAAYKELSALAETKLEKVQGDFLAEAHRDGQEQLVDFTKEEFIVLAAEGRLTESQLQRRRAQLWWADRFDNEMDQWIQDNPDKNKREGYQQEQMVLASYINTSHEEIEAIRTRTLLSLQEKDARRRSGRPATSTKPLIEGEIFPTPTKKLKDTEPFPSGPLGEVDAITGAAKRAPVDVDVTVKPPIKARKILMISRNGKSAPITRGGIGKALDLGFLFPADSNIQVKRNSTEDDVKFSGINIKPGKRVISFDGGETWQLLR